MILTALVVVLAIQSSCFSDQTKRYRGNWKSISTGHQGALRVRIRPNEDGTMQATFAGRFAVIVPFVYRATLVPTGNGGYSSSKSLGPLIGEYRMNAIVTSDYFNASYQAAGDQGSFTMRRVD